MVVLAFAALLEASGDALVRNGLRTGNASQRLLWFAAGALVLFSYGWVVNAPPWDFGRLLGLYIVFFFIAAQFISWLAFGQPPSRSVVIGGLLILGGGLTIALSEA